MNPKLSAVLIAASLAVGAATTAFALKDGEMRVNKVCVFHSPAPTPDGGVVFTWKFTADGIQKAGDRSFAVRAQGLLDDGMVDHAAALFKFAQPKMK